MTTSAQALLELTRARVSLIIEQPFFGNLALRLLLEEALWLPTLAIDGRKMYYNPDFVMNVLTPSLRKSGVAHEVMHCVLDHIGRVKGRDRAKWNIACDYAINLILKDAGFEIGKDWLLDEKYRGLSADHIYSLLPDPPPKEKGRSPGLDGSGRQPSDQSGGKPGAEADGGQRGLCDIFPSEDGTNDPGAAGKAKEDAFDWQVAVAAAAQQARIQGKLPGSLDRLVGEILGGKVDWRPVLWRFADEICKSEYSWSRPNRKYIPYSYYLPSLHSVGMGTVVLFLDTSGSINGPILEAFATEIRAVREAVRPKEIYVISVDAKVQRVDVFGEDDELVIKPKGGGGTDFCPAFQYLEEHGIEPACAIYLTDMYGSFPKEAPDYPVLWCATTDEKAPWGETVRINI